MKKNVKLRLFEMMKKINPQFNVNVPKLLLPIGISGSGKSTWIKKIPIQIPLLSVLTISVKS